MCRIETLALARPCAAARFGNISGEPRRGGRITASAHIMPPSACAPKYFRHTMNRQVREIHCRMPIMTHILEILHTLEDEILRTGRDTEWILSRQTRSDCREYRRHRRNREAGNCSPEDAQPHPRACPRHTNCERDQSSPGDSHSDMTIDLSASIESPDAPETLALAAACTAADDALCLQREAARDSSQR